MEAGVEKVTTRSSRPTVTVRSARFGSFEVPGSSVLRFPEGLVGFPDYHAFVIVEDPSVSPLRWLFCLDEPELAFAVVDPADFFEDYDPRTVIGTDAEAVALFAIVTIPRDRPARLSANLMAPVAVDTRTGVARQIVLDDGRYSTRHPLLPHSADI
jgi:flagellar assembly factor FliW